MSLNRQKHANFFPAKVYRCPCLLSVIDDCYDNDLNSFVELHDEVVFYTLEKGLGRIFAIKCGDELMDCIFCCSEHLKVVIFGKKNYDCTDKPSFENLTIYFNEKKDVCVGKTFCKGCIKNYLIKSYNYFVFKEF